MIVIRCNAILKPAQRFELENAIHEQAATGVIVLPECCDLVYANLAEETLVIKYADGGQAIICSGCAYRNRMATISGNLPENLLCPHHTPPAGQDAVFCPNWPPLE